MDRVAILLDQISRSPSDPFPLYGLAMELKSQKKWAQAADAFGKLIGDFPDYVPAYFQAGAVQQELGSPESAVEIYRNGIEVASRRGDQHARRELEAALSEVKEKAI